MCKLLCTKAEHNLETEINEMHFSKFDNILKETYKRRLIVYSIESVGNWTRVYPYDQKEAGLDPVNHDIVVVLNNEQYVVSKLRQFLTWNCFQFLFVHLYTHSSRWTYSVPHLWFIERENRTFLFQFLQTLWRESVLCRLTGENGGKL
jgi:hypothetical protein